MMSIGIVVWLINVFNAVVSYSILKYGVILKSEGNMIDINGKKVNIGDSVKLDNGTIGVVVCSIDNNKYSEEYTNQDWGI